MSAWRGSAKVGRHPFRVALTFLAVAVPLAGCGGSGARPDDRAKIEAGLRQYLGTLDVFSSSFPTGSGPPHVKQNSCKKLPGPQPPFAVVRKGGPKVRPPQRRIVQPPGPSSFWSCVVTFRGTYSLPVFVAAKGNGEVLDAQPAPRGSARPIVRPVTTYEGGG